MTVIKDIEELEKLGLEMQKELQMDLILQSLTSSYSQFLYEQTRLHYTRTNQHVGHYRIRNLEEFKGHYSYCGVDFF